MASPHSILFVVIQWVIHFTFIFVLFFHTHHFDIPFSHIFHTRTEGRGPGQGQVWMDRVGWEDLPAAPATACSLPLTCHYATSVATTCALCLPPRTTLFSSFVPPWVRSPATASHLSIPSLSCALSPPLVCSLLSPARLLTSASLPLTLLLSLSPSSCPSTYSFGHSSCLMLPVADSVPGVVGKEEKNRNRQTGGRSCTACQVPCTTAATHTPNVSSLSHLLLYCHPSFSYTTYAPPCCCVLPATMSLSCLSPLSLPSLFSPSHIYLVIVFVYCVKHCIWVGGWWCVCAGQGFLAFSKRQTHTPPKRSRTSPPPYSYYLPSSYVPTIMPLLVWTEQTGQGTRTDRQTGTKRQADKTGTGTCHGCLSYSPPHHYHVSPLSYMSVVCAHN